MKEISAVILVLSACAASPCEQLEATCSSCKVALAQAACNQVVRLNQQDACKAAIDTNGFAAASLACGGNAPLGATGLVATEKEKEAEQEEPATEISLEVTASNQTTEAPAWFPLSQDDVMLIVRLKITNATGTKLPLTPVQFTVDTDDGLAYLGDPTSEKYSDGCKSSALLGTGKSVECVLLFRTGRAGTKTLEYLGPGGLNAQTDFAARKCKSCGDDCVDVAVSTKHCGVCKNAVPAGAICADGRVACEQGKTLCSGACVDVQTSSAHCGACSNQVPSGMSCAGGEVKCALVSDTYCDGTCINTTWDEANCGGCGIACEGKCDDSQCHYDIESFQRRSCDAVCAPAVCVKTDLFILTNYTNASPSSPSCAKSIFGFECDEVPPNVIHGSGMNCTSDTFTYSSIECSCVR